MGHPPPRKDGQRHIPHELYTVSWKDIEDVVYDIILLRENILFLVLVSGNSVFQWWGRSVSVSWICWLGQPEVTGPSGGPALGERAGPYGLHFLCQNVAYFIFNSLVLTSTASVSILVAWCLIITMMSNSEPCKGCRMPHADLGW